MHIWIANNIISLIGKNPHLILFALILITVMMTEVMSHAAAVALMLPIGAGIASVSGLKYNYNNNEHCISWGIWICSSYRDTRKLDNL